MARMIDGDKLVENLRLIATCWSISPFVSKEKHNGAVDMLREVEREVKEMPTLTPPNEPLTLDDLREIDAPVWCSCKTIEGGNGYWCLCQRGHIITPAGSIFDVKEIPHWVFYRRPPEGEEDT